jgi:nitrogen fixation protein NifZ
MATPRFNAGDVVFSRAEIYNDGGVPDVPGGALLASAGTRGVVLRAGKERGGGKPTIYVVRFEGEDEVLGPAVSCLEEELADAP